MLAEYPQTVTHRRLPLLIYARMFQRSNFPLTPKSVFSSHRVFPSSGRRSPSSFPCVPDPPRAMPGSSLWREPALQAGPPGVRAASSSSSSSSSTAAAGQRYLQGPPGVSLPTPAVPHKRRVTQRTRALNALQQNHIWLQPTGKPNNRRQSTKNQHVYVHTHALLPPSSPAVFNRLRAAF